MKDDIVRIIKEYVDIVDLVSSYVNLEKRSDKFYGLCPFHNESKPSFTVDQQRGFYYCFGCQKGGDMIKFVESMENMDFIQAVNFICEKYGIKVNKEWKKSKKGINYLYKVNQTAMQAFFTNLCNTKEGQKAIGYLKKREITQKTIDEFSLGYSMESWNSLYNMLHAEYADNMLEVSGLFKKNDRGYLYDAYRNRVIFPIKDIHGRVIGFGGRIIDDSSQEAKYINSPKTSVYEKGRNLYGLDITRKYITRENSAILVEGYLDALALFQAGVKNVCACLGTALTELQVQLLKRYCMKFYICFDSDSAGVKSALSNFDIFQKYEIDTFYIDITPAKDPDEFIKDYGAQAFRERIQEAPSLEEIVIKRYIKSITEDKKSLDKELFMDTMARLLSIRDYIKRYKYFEELASLLNTRSDSMLREYKRNLRSRNIRKGPEKGDQPESFNVPQSEIKVLKALMLMTRDEIQYFQESIDGIISLNSPAKPLFEFILASKDENIIAGLKDSITFFDEKAAGLIIRNEQELEALSGDGKKELKKDIVLKLLNARLGILQAKISSESDKEMLESLIRDKIDIKRRILKTRGG